MSTSRVLASVLLLLLASGSAPAQSPTQDEGLRGQLERVLGENAVLRHELRTLQERLSALEERLGEQRTQFHEYDQRLVRHEERLDEWPLAGANGPGDPAPGSLTARLAEDYQNVLLPELRLGDDAGASGPEDLVALLHGALRAPEARGDDAGAQATRRTAIQRLAAYDPGPGHVFLVPAALWDGVRPEGAARSPALGELESILSALGPALVDSDLTRVQLLQRPSTRDVTTPRSANQSRVVLGVSSLDWDIGVRGARVTDVLIGTPAHTASLQRDDLIQSISVGEVVFPIARAADLTEALAGLDPGESITIGVRRPIPGSWSSSARDNRYSSDRYHSQVVVETVLGGRHSQSASDAHRGRRTQPASDAAAAAPPPGASPAQRLQLDFIGPLGPVSLTLVVVRVNGRWLVVSCSTEWFEQRAREVLDRVYQHQYYVADRAERGLVTQGLLDRLEGEGYGEVQRQSARILQLAFYRVQLVELPGREFGLIATPNSPAAPALILGPLPGEHELHRNPYRVRTRN
jgi:hypothetical protein